ncbi:MAG: DUF3419 family protein [Bacteroidota bacterium]
MPSTPIPTTTDAASIRYGQCWEDADVLLRGLDVQPGDDCLVIASAGDNALALLTRDPRRVVAIDHNPAQLECLALRVAAYRTLQHPELLELMGSRPSTRRRDLYARCRTALAPQSQRFWDARLRQLDGGLGQVGRFEQYFRLFRRYVLPLVHPQHRVRRLLRGGGSTGSRAHFYDLEWCSWRWRSLSRLFFSRSTMAHFGRDPGHFTHVEGPVASRVLARARHAAVALDPAENPYLAWILTGQHGEALTLALRPEHFDTIRDGLDRLSWRCATLGDVLRDQPSNSFDRFGLSDVFEYVSEPKAHALMADLVRVGRTGGRVAYWNLLVPRRRPDHLAPWLRPCDSLATALHAEDKAFFYSRFVVEDITEPQPRAQQPRTLRSRDASRPLPHPTH